MNEDLKKYIESIIESNMAVIYDKLESIENELIKCIPIYKYYDIPYELSNFEAKMIVKRLVADYAEIKELDVIDVYKILYGKFAYKNKTNIWLLKSKSDDPEQSMLDFIINLNEDAKYGLLISAYDLFDLTITGEQP